MKLTQLLLMSGQLSQRLVGEAALDIVKQKWKFISVLGRGVSGHRGVEAIAVRGDVGFGVDLAGLSAIGVDRGIALVGFCFDVCKSSVFVFSEYME